MTPYSPLSLPLPSQGIRYGVIVAVVTDTNYIFVAGLVGALNAPAGSAAEQ